MKINGNFEVEVKADPACPMGAPVISVRSSYNLDMSETEHERTVALVEKVNQDWLQIRQEIVKTFFVNASFKDLVAAGYAAATQVIQRFKKAA